MGPVPQTYSTAGAFVDEFEPQDSLKAQPDYNVEMPYQPSWTDLASPTSLLRDAIWAVTGLGKVLGMCDRQYDIFEVVLKPVCGDWAGIKATGVTMNNSPTPSRTSPSTSAGPRPTSPAAGTATPPTPPTTPSPPSATPVTTPRRRCGNSDRNTSTRPTPATA
jgi:hypothetical protein